MFSRVFEYVLIRLAQSPRRFCTQANYECISFFKSVSIPLVVPLLIDCLRVFLSLYVLPGVSRGVFYSTFSLKNINLSISEIPLKAWQAQCFSRSRHPGGREKVTKKVVGIRWKN